MLSNTASAGIIDRNDPPGGKPEPNGYINHNNNNNNYQDLDKVRNVVVDPLWQQHQQKLFSTKRGSQRPEDLKTNGPFMLWTDSFVNSLEIKTTNKFGVYETTPNFHSGMEVHSELHCEDCDMLPRGVGLILSSIVGCSFVMLYLCFVQFVWKKCPNISKPPDAHLIALEESRRPNLKSRLLAIAEQTAGELGVPIKKPMICITREPLCKRFVAYVVFF